MCLAIPERLHQRSRLTLEHLQDSLLLYRRVESIVDDISIIPFGTGQNFEIFPLKSDSYNQSADSTPDDVLYNVKDRTGHYVSWGIIKLPIIGIRQLSVAHPTEEGTLYSMEVYHAPIHCMYPHCDVKVLKKNDKKEETIDDLSGPKTVKSYFRSHLNNLRARPIKAPGVFTSLEIGPDTCEHLESI